MPRPSTPTVSPSVGLGAPHALERDRAERDGGRGVEAELVRHPRDEVHGHGDHLCVVREPGARARDAVARREAVDLGAGLDDDAGAE